MRFIADGSLSQGLSELYAAARVVLYTVQYSARVDRSIFPNFPGAVRLVNLHR